MPQRCAKFLNQVVTRHNLTRERNGNETNIARPHCDFAVICSLPPLAKSAKAGTAETNPVFEPQAGTVSRLERGPTVQDLRECQCPVQSPTKRAQRKKCRSQWRRRDGGENYHCRSAEGTGLPGGVGWRWFHAYHGQEPAPCHAQERCR